MDKDNWLELKSLLNKYNWKLTVDQEGAWFLTEAVACFGSAEEVLEWINVEFELK